ncbi:MAG: A/G-specific adenine glycosylase, partial [Planctomycetia bacterium]|nr:A/G-specific adenine glycosylase [Planctomycetia bacterium]
MSVKKTDERAFRSEAFATTLLRWFDRYGRELPWRNPADMTGSTTSPVPGDPYRIWVSEIMLQQTQVATVVPYFQRWMERFPTIPDLADSSESEVLRYWEGLGYYRRARMLHQASIRLTSEYGGKIPTDPRLLMKLPGIGRYTAGAILSIALGIRLPILEANTQRLYARLMAMTDDPTTTRSQRRLWDFAAQLLPSESGLSESDPSGKRFPYGRLNQSLMELGSLLCVSRNPMCATCPVSRYCESRCRGSDLVSRIPAFRERPAITSVHEATILVYRPRLTSSPTRDGEFVNGGVCRGES